MLKNPLPKKNEETKENLLSRCKKLRSPEISYDLIVKGYKWFRYNDDFKTTDMYYQINKLDHFSI